MSSPLHRAMTDASRPHPVGVDLTGQRLVRLQDDLDELLIKLSEAESRWADWLAAVAPEHQASARNLVHYWSLRQVDLRELQARLAAFGLSSLGRSEPHVQATLGLVRAAISAMLGDGWTPPQPPAVPIDDGVQLLRERTAALLGPVPAGRSTRIMVTLPSEAAADPALIRRLMAGGMNIARINCAHDDAPAWRAMAEHVRTASAERGATCGIAMDLAGPKLRTGPLEPGPRSVRLRPQKDGLGRVVVPAYGWLTPAESPAGSPRPGLASLPVPERWLRRRRPGDVIHLRDTRGARRRLLVEQTERSGGLQVQAAKTTYLATGTVLDVEGAADPVELGELPQTEQSLTLRRGDVLELTRDCSPAPVDAEGIPRIGCTLPEIFDYARVGEQVLIDDGRIGGRIIRVNPDTVAVRVEHAAAEGAKLRAGKGINVPDTSLPIRALTTKDISDLRVVAEMADLVEMSFVRHPADVEQLLDELDKSGNDSLGVILKIETRQAFEHLPQLLLTAMRRPRVGVMIARGDLAVECGYERLAELQEEILWLSEAAHLPVIWATQVLEQLAKTGNPSRAEISDAAMSERAECAMLNKGPYIDQALAALDNILRRMAEHHYKKNALLRSLKSWQPTP